MFSSEALSNFLVIKVVNTQEDSKSVTNFTVELVQAHCKYWDEEHEVWDHKGCKVSRILICRNYVLFPLFPAMRPCY